MRWGLGAGGGGGDTVDREDGELNDSERRRLGAGVTKMPNHVNLHVLSSNLRCQPPRSNLLFIVSLVVCCFFKWCSHRFFIKKKKKQPRASYCSVCPQRHEMTSTAVMWGWAWKYLSSVRNKANSGTCW